MGCWLSRAADRSKAYEVKEADQPTIQAYTWDAAQRPDPKDFMLTNLKGETRVRLPGSINGQQFIIENCEDCNIYLFDHSAAVTLDDCKNCRIFVGPVESSIFIRDCSDCKCVVVCRQFRTRDCHRCDCLLFCRTQPIIESSTKMGLGCYDYNYKGLTDHLQAVQMSIWHNFWSRIHDFTPDAANWHFLPEETTTERLLGPLPEACQELRPTADSKGVVVTRGERPALSQEYCWILFPPATAGNAYDFASQAAALNLTLLRSNEAKMDASMAASIVEKAGWAHSLSQTLQSGNCVGLEFGGEACVMKLAPLAEKAGVVFTANPEVPAVFRYHGVDG
ncbi:hypothetical protein WJX72_011217 [[Myrmecia] bisecta]|uniref:C-CAP/cofactor C-like domain-containing protein n=1 Tax=[Myrmecia] bisecta TaxID=41462 RepID=A0AAW1Q3L7_9CHLO